jgi:hypothetical protein
MPDILALESLLTKTESSFFCVNFFFAPFTPGLHPGRMWEDVGGCGRMWEDVGGCGRMWEVSFIKNVFN